MERLRKTNRYKGLAVVEAALILPILLIFLMGLIEYGWLFLKSHQITNTVRQAARVAIRADATNTDVIDNTIVPLMTNAGLDGKYTYQIIPDNVSSAAVGDFITVKITVPYANIDILNILLLPKPDAIGASVTMSKEGF